MEKINIYNKYFVMDSLCKKPKVYDDATGNGGADLRCGLNVHIYLNGAESHMQKRPN